MVSGVGDCGARSGGATAAAAVAAAVAMLPLLDAASPSSERANHNRHPNHQGNTHAKRSLQGDEAAAGAAEACHVGSPPVSPGSPLTYTPQVAMEPLAHESSAARLGTEFVGAAGWPAQPKLVPVEITCERACWCGWLRACAQCSAGLAAAAPGTLLVPVWCASHARSSKTSAAAAVPAQGATGASTCRWRARLTTGPRASRCSAMGGSSPLSSCCRQACTRCVC
jgi:hypothetical protein